MESRGRPSIRAGHRAANRIKPWPVFVAGPQGRPPNSGSSMAHSRVPTACGLPRQVRRQAWPTHGTRHPLSHCREAKKATIAPPDPRPARPSIAGPTSQAQAFIGQRSRQTYRRSGLGCGIPPRRCPWRESFSGEAPAWRPERIAAQRERGPRCECDIAVAQEGGVTTSSSSNLAMSPSL